MNIYLKPKIFRALKLSTLCLILGVEAGFATESYSQKTTFTISVQDQSVKEVFDYIEQHSEFIIFYLDETIDVNRKVSVNLKGQRVESILEQLFKNTDVTYTINDRQILLSKRKTEIKTIPVIAISQQQKNMVTGVVLDPHGMPVIGANILVKGRLTVPLLIWMVSSRWMWIKMRYWLSLISVLQVRKSRWEIK